MKKVFEELNHVLEQGNQAMLVFVLKGTGSTPRKSGSVMLVGKEKQFGTIGGGNVEYQSTLLARELLQSKESYQKEYDLTENDRESLGMICGGKMKIAFYFCDEKDRETVARINQYYEDREECYLILQMEENGFRLNVEKGKASYWYEESRLKDNIYIQTLVEKGTVYIFGGGHISQQLVEILEKLSFSCMVTDNDAHFLKAFETGKYQVIDFEKIEQELTLIPEDYAIIVTRGHEYDKQVLNQLLDFDLTYVGMIGSRRKIQLTYEAILTQKPELKEKIASVHAPIGLPIGAQTPEEIAVSIAAELIQVRYEKKNS